MTSYIVIDGYLGEVMGAAEAATPVEAVRQVYQSADPTRDFSAERELVEHGPNWGKAAPRSEAGWGNAAQSMDNVAFVHVGSAAEVDRVAVVEMRPRG